jgi:2-(1,2-epoxy-1,2-dihydrophenyl)acetyl-CoA isomerase
MADEVLVSREGAVLTVTLNRPEVLNALTGAVHSGLRAALKEAAGDPEVRAVVITGAGRGFCVGQDLTEFSDTPDVGAALRATYHPTVHALRALEKPVVAAINGPAAGAGVSLACACDIRIASDAAFFAPGFVNIGLVPDAGGTYFIARLLGPARAFEWMSSGRRITADEALGWGLVTEVAEAERFGDRVAEYAAGLAAMPTRAIGWNKRLFDHATTATLDEQLELEAQLQAVAAQTGDFAEGVAAFLEKRAPSFKGA